MVNPNRPVWGLGRSISRAATVGVVGGPVAAMVSAPEISHTTHIPVDTLLNNPAYWIGIEVFVVAFVGLVGGIAGWALNRNNRYTPLN